MSLYFRTGQLGEPGDWAGADLVSYRFRRNMRIYSNVVEHADSRTSASWSSTVLGT